MLCAAAVLPAGDCYSAAADDFDSDSGYLAADDFDLVFVLADFADEVYFVGDDFAVVGFVAADDFAAAVFAD